LKRTAVNETKQNKTLIQQINATKQKPNKALIQQINTTEQSKTKHLFKETNNTYSNHRNKNKTTYSTNQ
jgi:hypothetical protein